MTCLSDVWRIDGVGIDWTPVKALHATEVPLLSALGPDERSTPEPLARADAQYVTVLPGRKIDCRFRAQESASPRRALYALKVQGYLHEWPSAVRAGDGQAMAASMTGAAKIAHIKALLRMKGVLLPPICAEWKQLKSQLAGRGSPVP